MAIGEYSEDMVQGVEEGGAFTNYYIMGKMNDATRHVFHILKPRIPDQFLTSATLAFTSSVATLPWNFGNIHQLRDENGYKVGHKKARQRRLTTVTGNDSYYYQQGNTYILDRDNVTKNYTLQYYTKPRELDIGRITASGSLTITLDGTAKQIDDYYNGMEIRDVNSDWTDTVSDYTSARVATITSQSLNIDDNYGFVPEIPEPFHFLIPLKAIIDIRLEHPLVFTNVSPLELTNFNDMVMHTLAAFGDNDEDIPLADIINDYTGYRYYTRFIED